jgi:hypothetical protein
MKGHMRIDILFSRIRDAENSWKNIKDDFKCDFETVKYLSKAYLVLHTSRCQATVAEFKDNTFSTLLSAPQLLQNTPLNRKFLKKFEKNDGQGTEISKSLASLFEYIEEGNELDP